MPEIKIDNLTKRFKEVVAVDDLTFSFPEGQVTCLLGPSGCGKTTLLRMIAGLEAPTSGSIYFGDIDLTQLPPRKRNIGMVFQYPVVYRGISVYKNIELPLLKRNIPANERRQRIEEALELLNLQDQADKDSSQLDNVSRQKVSVARAISYHPDIILFDEPMTNIDANSRVQFSHFFKELSKKLNQVIVYVTHDQTEAMTLADQIALMEDGRMVQCNEPRALYNEPEEVFGGWFLGNPGMNFIAARCEQAAGKNVLSSSFFPSPLGIATHGLDREVTIGIRPEHISVSKTAFSNAVNAKVKRKSITVGGQFLLVIEVDKVEVKAKVSHPSNELMSAQSVWVEFPLEHIVLFDQHQKRVHADLTYARK
ncbi:MAG: ABC transporter ATP-binding protein [Desulfobacterales bacterium]